MAVTQNPIVWDFYRKTPGSSVLGGVAHYYTEEAQSFWNTSSGLQTNLCHPARGAWEGAEQSQAVAVSPLASNDFDLDHPYNGTLFGASATKSGELQFLRYTYAMDCTDLISSGNISYKNDSASAQFKANIMNIHEGIFMDDATLFQPGAKITFKVVAGNEEPYAMCVAYLDSADYNINSTNVPISGRNTVGFKLMQSTFDDTTEISGEAHQVVALIMDMAGVTSYSVEQRSGSRKHEFKPDQTFMSGLEQVCELYSDWKVIELPDGTIVVGSASYISNYQTNGYYIFKLYEHGDGGKFALNRSLFKRKTKRSCDAAYTKVRITGRDADGNDLQPVTVPVANYSHWYMPKNKTYHESTPDGLTQDELQTYAEDVAAHLQYVGVGEDFTCSLQPHLLIGDVAAFDNGDNTITPLGIITDVKHNFGKSGFTTDFSTDSGGLLANILEILFTKTKSLNGYNRKQTLKDLIQVASGSSVAGPRAPGAVVKVSTDRNAETVGGKTPEQIVAESQVTPSFDLTSLGLPIIPLDGTPVELTVDTIDIRTALNNGRVKLTFRAGEAESSFAGVITPDVFYLPESDTYHMMSRIYNVSFYNIVFTVDTTKIVAQITPEGVVNEST